MSKNKSNFKDKLLFQPKVEIDAPFEGFVEVIPEEEYFRRQREAMGLTQRQVAEICKIDIRQYQRIESGERYISSATFRLGIRICAALSLDPHRFVYCGEEPKRTKKIYFTKDVFRERREELGLTQKEVADRAHITVRQYQRIESGSRHIRTSSLRIGLSICDALEMDPKGIA